jgi:hypothetical protein
VCCRLLNRDKDIALGDGRECAGISACTSVGCLQIKIGAVMEMKVEDVRGLGCSVALEGWVMNMGTS